MADTNKTYLYEALVLLSQTAGADFNASLEHVREILQRANAEIHVLRRWDERRLAFNIRGQKRGLYILAIFTAPGEKLGGIERDCNLSEKIVRTLVTRADHMGEVELDLAKREAVDASLHTKLNEGEATGDTGDAGEAGDVEGIAASMGEEE